MKFEDALKFLNGIPHIQTSSAKVLYNFVLNGDIKYILELGFAHGVSTCYMAAALEEKGVGLITTIDNQAAKRRKPDIFELLRITNLEKYVNPIFADTSYNWELMKMIDKQTEHNKCEPIFNFCFIDGAHSWEVDGLAFFLSEKLLKPGGWILFDDLNWSYSSSPTLKDTDFVKKMPDDQKYTPQITKVFFLLAKQHPNFENFRIDKEWGWAQKSKGR